MSDKKERENHFVNHHEVKYQTAEEIFFRGGEAVGKTIGEIDWTGRAGLSSDATHRKAGVGYVIEESWYGYKINNDAEPDFTEAGVELKATPIVKSKKKDEFRAKERLVLNIINYMEEFNKSFEDSSFWKKNKKLMLMFYEYIKDVPQNDLMIKAAALYSYPEEDLLIIKEDWGKIVDKIKSGKAHEISEGDTLYLGACTKGANAASSLRKQPKCDIPAKQRAFSLKQSYMTYVVQNYIFGKKVSPKIQVSLLPKRKVSRKSLPDALIKNEKIVKEVGVLYQYGGLENYIEQTVGHFKGWLRSELCEYIHLETTAKNVNELIVSRLLGLQGHLRDSEEFKKADVVIKTISLRKNGKVKESMSFPYFDFCELVQQRWEESQIYNLFESTRFFFVVFRNTEDGDTVLEKTFFWNMPLEDLSQVYKVWNRTVKILKDGVVVQRGSRGSYNNLPKSTENPVAHVRPHARNSKDVLPLPTGGTMSKQCFWLNSSYVQKIVDAHE